MGTPCAIGMTMEDGSVRAIRCNYDGYVAGVGVILGGCLCKKQFLTFFKKTLDFYLILHYTGTIIVTGQCIYNQVIFYYGGIYHDNSQPEFRTE